MSAPQPIPFAPEGPQPLLREIPPGAPYPVEALGPLRAAVEAVAGETLAPVAIPAASALAVASLAVQGFGDVETLGGPRPVSLYALTIAQSGERKSSCDAALMVGLRSFEREAAKEHGQALQSWQNAYALWKGDRDKALADAKGAKAKDKRAAAEADLDALKEPAAPPSPDRTVNEPTYEGLTRKFAEGMPSLGIFSDEGGQFLGGHAMSSDNRQKTLAALNDLWQGNSIRRTRQGDGHLVMYGRRLAVHLMVQPGVARAFMADPMAADTGFLPRFLLCEPASTIGTRLHSRMSFDRAALEAFAGRLGAILQTSLPKDEETRTLEPRTLPLASDARALLTRFADAVEVAQRKDGEFANLTGTASKAAEQACRIAGTLTLWSDLHAPEVTGETMADAIMLAQFYLAEALRLADAATVSVEIDRAEALRRWLLEKWPHPEILPSEVVRHAPIRALRESPSAKKALEMLAAHGWLEALPEGAEVRGASRKLAYHIVRSGHEV